MKGRFREQREIDRMMSGHKYRQQREKGNARGGSKNEQLGIKMLLTSTVCVEGG